MSFMAIIPDKFDKRAVVEAWKAKSDRMKNVRRPTRGIQLKEDSYATLRVVKADGTVIPLVDAGARGQRDTNTAFSDTYSNFMIQAVTEERVEKQQIVETFGESFIFFYGERPRIISIQGVLLNTFDFNWEAEWWHNYETYLRGTKCVENGARVYLTYDETMIAGYIMATGSTKQAVEKNHVPFQFQMFLTDYVLLSRVGDPSADQTYTRPLTRAEMAQGRTGMYKGTLSPFRPAAVKKLEISKGGFGLIGFLGGIATAIMSTTTSAVSGARAMSRQLANYANMPAAYLDMFCANPVRIPMGFAGSLVFDDKPVDLNNYSAAIDRPIRYTVFGDNTDEFVALPSEDDQFGMSAYYASASVALGNKLAEPFSEVPNAKWANAVTEKGYAQFRSWGLVPPNDMLSNSLQVLAQNPYGLMLIRGAKTQLGKIGAKVSTQMNQAIDQAEAKIMPYVAGSQAVLGGIATADRIATMNGVRTGMVDRSAMSFDRPQQPAYAQAQAQSTVGGQLDAWGPQGSGSAPPTIAGNFTPQPNSESWTNARLAGPVSGAELTGVETKIPPTQTRITTLPKEVLPANANQLLTNPLANPGAALQAFQALQPISTTPLATMPVFKF